MQLDEFRRIVNWNLACGTLVDLDLPVTSDDGGYPVVVALDGEPLRVLLARLRAVGGFANLFVWSDEHVHLVSVIDNRCAIAEADDHLSALPERPGANATVGMFLEYLALCPRGVVLSLVTGDANRPAVARDSRTVEFAAANP